ncbi:MAG: dihydrofolate reductase [Methylomonas sp.]
MKISLIVAMASNRAIGLDGQMPWHLSADLKHFKQVTMGAPIVMGRKTFAAIGRPLPGRRNLVVSRNPDYWPSGCDVFTDINSALQACGDWDEVFIIGGATLYQALLPYADYLYLTEIHRAFEADTFFPDFDRQVWQEVARQDIDNDASVDFSYSFLKLANLQKQAITF